MSLKEALENQRAVGPRWKVLQHAVLAETDAHLDQLHAAVKLQVEAARRKYAGLLAVEAKLDEMDAQVKASFRDVESHLKASKRHVEMSNDQILNAELVSAVHSNWRNCLVSQPHSLHLMLLLTPPRTVLCICPVLHLLFACCCSATPPLWSPALSLWQVAPSMQPWRVTSHLGWGEMSWVPAQLPPPQPCARAPPPTSHLPYRRHPTRTWRRVWMRCWLRTGTPGSSAGLSTCTFYGECCVCKRLSSSPTFCQGAPSGTSFPLA